MDVAVIVLAAGRGTRAAAGGVPLPKQYRRLGGVAVLQHSLSAFARNHKVEGIQPVIHCDDRALFDAGAAGVGCPVIAPVIGGATRRDSVFAGLQSLAAHAPQKVLIHDAARPFPPQALIDRVIDALEEATGAVPALPVSDTLKKVAGGRVTATLDRSGLWAAQTPQGFHFDAILAAHKAAARHEGTEFTDDAAIAAWHGMDVAVVEGDPANLKLTAAGDFALAESMLGGGEHRIGQGYDVHAFAEGDHVVLCGVLVPHDKALAGHSDADVGLHALTDALLGAVGDGDIGTHFPPDDPQWRGAASDIFLRHAAKRVRAAGGAIVNVDVTLVCESPMIGPYRQAMRDRIAGTLEITPERVSVKATTTEGLGFTGRREGIAASATASVRMAPGG